jgi:hypothetical protein
MHTLKMAAALALGLGFWASGASAQQGDTNKLDAFMSQPGALEAARQEALSLGPDSVVDPAAVRATADARSAYLPDGATALGAVTFPAEPAEGQAVDENVLKQVR